MIPGPNSHDILPMRNASGEPTIWVVPHECLDVTSREAFWQALTERLGLGPVVIDLAFVRFADSCGIAALVRAKATSPGSVALMNVTPALERCLSRAPADALPPLFSSPFAPVAAEYRGDSSFDRSAPA